MGSSTLITGGSKSLREKEILKISGLKTLISNPDILVVESDPGKKSIGIDQVKKACAFLEEKPYSQKSKFLIIKGSSELTIQAQNALLKTLEEPPLYATIFLESKSEKGILKTVLSRCKRIRVKLSEENLIDRPDDYYKFLSSNVGERLYWSNELSKEDRDVIIDKLEAFISYSRNNLLDKHLVKCSSNIKKLLEVKEVIEDTNINIQLALDHLALELDI